jgi:ADP-ribose pyrophosphatase YjhB (NUDIX family)
MTSGVAIFDGSGAVLLVHQAYGEQMFCPPGGVVEPGEDPHAAAMREAQEEIGVLPSIVALGGVTLNVHADGPRMDFLFIAELPMGADRRSPIGGKCRRSAGTTLGPCRALAGRSSICFRTSLAAHAGSSWINVIERTERTLRTAPDGRQPAPQNGASR